MKKLRELWGVLVGWLVGWMVEEGEAVECWEFDEHEREAMRKYFRWANARRWEI